MYMPLLSNLVILYWLKVKQAKTVNSFAKWVFISQCWERKLNARIQYFKKSVKKISLHWDF